MKTRTCTTGLPGSVGWTFNFDATSGTFGFAGSLYDNPRDPLLYDGASKGSSPSRSAWRSSSDRTIRR